METVDEFMKKKRAELLNKIIRAKDISRKGFHLWKIEAVTLLPQSTYSEKVFVFERIRYNGPEGDVPPVHALNYQDYRIGYWIVGKIGSRKDKWTWGQFCPFIPIDDFEKLIGKAKKDGTIPASIKQP